MSVNQITAKLESLDTKIKTVFSGLFQVGDKVQNNFGTGEILEIRDDGIYVVTLTNWYMADGKSPKLYLQESAIKKIPSSSSIKTGDKVACNFGTGHVQDVRADGVYVVTLTNWFMADGKSPTLYLQESALTKIITSSFTKGDKVSCNFGTGELLDIRADGVYVVTLFNWFMADGKSPRLYLQESAIKKVGECVFNYGGSVTAGSVFCTTCNITHTSTSTAKLVSASIATETKFTPVETAKDSDVKVFSDNKTVQCVFLSGGTVESGSVFCGTCNVTHTA